MSSMKTRVNHTDMRKCPFKGCSYSTTNNGCLFLHKRYKHRRRWSKLTFKCNDCHKVFLKKTTFEEHVKVHKEIHDSLETTAEFGICPHDNCCHPLTERTFNRRHKLFYHSDHKKTWILYGKWKDNSQIHYQRKKDIIEKMSMEQVVENFALPIESNKCSLCSFQTINPVDLGMHFILSHCYVQNKFFQCGMTNSCSAKFKEITDLLGHVKIFHKKNFFITPKSDGKIPLEIYYCHSCEYGFLEVHKFVNHMKVFHPSLIKSGSRCKKCCKMLAVTNVLTEDAINYCPASVLTHDKITIMKRKTNISNKKSNVKFEPLPIYSCCKCNGYKTFVRDRFIKHERNCTQ